MRNVCNATLRSLASAMFRHFLHSISVSLCRSLKCFHRKAGRRLMQIYHHQSYIHLGIAKHIASIGAIQCERRCSSTKGNSRPGPWANCLVRGLLPITGTEMRQLGSWFAGFLQQPISSLWTHWNPFFHFTQQPAAEQNQDARLTLPSSCATASRHLCDGACRQRWRCDNRYFARTNIRDLGVSKSLESLKGRRIYNFFSCVFFFFFILSTCVLCGVSPRSSLSCSAQLRIPSKLPRVHLFLHQSPSKASVTGANASPAIRVTPRSNSGVR